MMKKVMRIILIAVMVANVFLSTTPLLNKKSNLSLAIPKAMADGEIDPPPPGKDPSPRLLLPDGSIVIVIP